MGDRGSLTLRERRELVSSAQRALAGVADVLWQAGGDELAEVLGEVDRLVATGEAARVAVAAEALERGEPGSGARAQSPVDWVREHAPSLRAGGAAQVVRLAQAFAVPGNAAVKESVSSGRLPVRSAAVVVAEADRLRPLLADGAEEAVVDGLIEMAASHGPRGCRSLRPALLARYGLDGVLDREQEAARRFVALSQPRVGELGVAEYSLTLDPEGRAVLESALGPLSAPSPVDGERDLRPAQQRRGEALVSLVRRAVASGESVPTTTKAQLFVSVDLETLRDRVVRDAERLLGGAELAGVGLDAGNGLFAAGEVVGGPESGVLLAPETVRRLACEATVIPVVLGSASEPLDLGRAVRLFTAGQVRRLWLRDGGCSFPGCTMPAHWTEAHHLVHWADGGESDLGNAALLCQRHHTVVHARRLAGRVVGDQVEWDLTPGGYDLLLAQRLASEPA